jgi:hypothetical protein
MRPRKGAAHGVRALDLGRCTQRPVNRHRQILGQEG